jgi:hypothetical protein
MLLEAQRSIVRVFTRRFNDLDDFIDELPPEATPQTVINGMAFIDKLNPFRLPENYRMVDGHNGKTNESKVIQEFWTIFENIHNYLEKQSELNIGDLQARMGALRKRI